MSEKIDDGFYVVPEKQDSNQGEVLVPSAGIDLQQEFVFGTKKPGETEIGGHCDAIHKQFETLFPGLTPKEIASLPKKVFWNRAVNVRI